VRVDAERRPDLADRYDLGGYPTTAFLNPRGALIGGGTAADVPLLLAQLDRLRDVVAGSPALLEAADPPWADQTAAGAADPGDDDLLAAVFAGFDGAHGGFGTSPKYPHTAAIDLALDLAAATADGRAATMAAASLDGIGWNGLADPVDGGFYRCADGPAWDRPRTEKLLDVNAALLTTYARAASVLDAGRYRVQVADGVRYLQTWLADHAAGAWYASQAADADYYADRDPASRARRMPPAVDTTVVAAPCGGAIVALLQAASLLAGDDLVATAVAALERIAGACYRPGAGLAHDASPGAVRGLLADHVAVAAAALDVFEVTGNIVYQMLAEELMRYALRTMWSDEAGAFLDREPAEAVEAVGRLATRYVPFVANCRAATVLDRPATTAGDDRLRAPAARILAATRRLAAAAGPAAAHHLLAVRAAEAR
jgi:uncharacterized protein